MADLLRNLADKLDGIDRGGDTDDTQKGQLTPIDDIEAGDTDTTKMVPPLQAKLEILKKSEGLPNVYDTVDSKPDELAMIKKNAGITVAQQEASDDNDVTG